MLSQNDLFSLLSSQSSLNKVLKTKSLQSNTSKVFKQYTTLLESSNYSFKLKISKVKCEYCSNPIKQSPPIILPCTHYICSEVCIQELSEIQLQGQYNLYDRVRCLCGKIIPSSIILKCLQNMEGFSLDFRNCEELSEPSFECAICWQLKKMRKFRTLDCDHRFCEDCIKQHVQGCIKTGQVGEKLGCPECLKAIQYHIAADLLDLNIKEQYERFLMMRVECKNNERFFACPGKKCENAEIISNYLKVFECFQCNAKYCVDCKGDEHPNQSCEEKARVKLIEDPLIREKFNQGEMKQCPWCLNGVEKDPRGCKYITCRSIECEGKRWFCFDCGKKLKKFHEQHACITPEVETRHCVII